MARTLVITTDAKPVFPGSNASSPVPQTIYNTGTAVVYLGEDDAVQPYSGAPLSPGSTIQWDPDRSCYALTSPGMVGSVVVLDNEGYLFDAGAIANQILDLGLATDIAAQIALTGAPPIDRITNLGIPTIFGSGAFPVYDTSGYQTVMVKAIDIDTTPGPAPVARKWILQWTDASGALITREEFWGQDYNSNGNADVIFRTSVKGQRLTITAEANATAGNQLTVSVTGSYKTVAKSTYMNPSAFWLAGGGVAYGSGYDNYAARIYDAYPGNTQVDHYPPSKAGQCQFMVGALGTAGYTFRAYLLDLASGVPLYTTGLLTVPASGLIELPPVSLLIPNRPLQVRLITAGGPVAWTNVRYSIVYSD